MEKLDEGRVVVCGKGGRRIPAYLPVRYTDYRFFTMEPPMGSEPGTVFFIECTGRKFNKLSSPHRQS